MDSSSDPNTTPRPDREHHAFNSRRGQNPDLEKPLSSDSDVRLSSVVTEDNGFGGEGGRNFRNMSKWDATFALLTNQVGLGILSLPGVLKTFGIIPGVIAIVSIGILSWYTAFVLRQFYGKHPLVLNVVDMCRIVGGPGFEIIGSIGFLVQVIMTAASAAVTLSIAFNTISNHAMCTVGFIGIGCLCCFILCLPRTVKFVSKSGIFCCASIVSAALIVMVSLGSAAPTKAPEHWHREIAIAKTPSFRDSVNACLKIVYAYSGNINFVGYMAEMADPMRDFGFALAWLEITSISFYVIVAIAIYCLAGQYTISPALGSASHIVARVAYGIVLPAVLTTGLAFGHTGIKYIYVVVMKQYRLNREMTANTVRSWSIWAAIVTIFWFLCFLLSNAIPVFDSILAMSSATTISWFTFGLSAVFWLYLNRGRWFQNWRQVSLFCLNCFLIQISLFCNIAGLWSSITELLEIYANKDTSIHGAFDCGNNASF